MTYIEIDASIIIPTYNEEKYIANLLKSIYKNLNHSNLKYEVIVVNNGSTDRTAEIISKFECTVLHIEPCSISFARNYGAKKSNGRITIFLDADIRLTSSWASELEKKMPQITSNKLLTGARYIIREDPSWIERNWFKPLSEKNVSYINGGNLIMSRNTFNSIGGFDENLITGEDYEFSMRAKKLGIEVCPNIYFQAIHDGFPSTIKAFLKREIWHGKGDYHSLSTFTASRIAQVSLFFGVTHIALLVNFLYENDFFFGLSLITIISILIILVSFKVFIKHGENYVLRNLPMVYLYLAGRFFSAISATTDKLQKKPMGRT